MCAILLRSSSVLCNVKTHYYTIATKNLSGKYLVLLTISVQNS